MASMHCLPDTKMMSTFPMVSHISHIAAAKALRNEDLEFFPLPGLRINSIEWPRPQVATSHVQTCSLNVFEPFNGFLTIQRASGFHFNQHGIPCFTRTHSRDILLVDINVFLTNWGSRVTRMVWWLTTVMGQHQLTGDLKVTPFPPGFKCSCLMSSSFSFLQPSQTLPLPFLIQPLYSLLSLSPLSPPVCFTYSRSLFLPFSF